MAAFAKVLVIAGVLSAIGFYPVISSVSRDLNKETVSLYGPVLIGLLLSGAMFLITNYYTAKKYKPVQQIAKASESGHGPNVITGLAIGMKSTIAPIILITEVQIETASSTDYDFVEFYNPNDADVDLTGWYIQRKTKTADSWGLKPIQCFVVRRRTDNN